MKYRMVVKTATHDVYEVEAVSEGDARDWLESVILQHTKLELGPWLKASIRSEPRIVNVEEVS